MGAFDRTFVPRQIDWLEHPAPLISTTQGNKREIRQTAAVGVSWRETWGLLNTNTQAVRKFLFEVQRLWSSGESFTIRPHEYETATGTLPTDSAGQVNGASQVGASLITDTWFPASGAILQGDYITVAGLGYSLWPTSDVTVAGAAATIPVFPAIASGDAPADGAAVTVNGPLTARIVERPNIPRSLVAVDFYDGLSITFAEDV